MDLKQGNRGAGGQDKGKKERITRSLGMHSPQGGEKTKVGRKRKIISRQR